MKKAKIILSVIAICSAIAGAFASKVNKFAGTPNIFDHGSGTYIPVFPGCQFPKVTPFEETCGTIPFTGYYYKDNTGGYHLLSVNTILYTVIK